MAPTVQTLSDASATGRGVIDLFAWAKEIRFAYAWMSRDDRRRSPWSCFPFAKVTQGVVGLQFAGTDVEVLEQFLRRIPKKIRVMYEIRGTFHSKILIGLRNNKARVILGSANFTRAAFSANYEVNILLEGQQTDPSIAALLEIVETYYESPKSRDLDAALVQTYRIAWQRRPKPPKLPLLPRRGRRTPTLKVWNDLNVGWEAYFDLLRAQDDRNFVNLDGAIRVIPTANDDNAYLTELGRCHQAFVDHKSLAKMPITTRQIVAGFGESLGWFGLMGGAGFYKQLVNTKPAALSAALDEIAVDRDIDEAEFVDVTQRALAIRGVGLACWTRLLSMKRPDLFLSVNSANKPRLRELLNRAPASPSGYWALTQRILELPWATAPAPSDAVERQIWDGRVALLDALLYKPARGVG